MFTHTPLSTCVCSLLLLFNVSRSAVSSESEKSTWPDCSALAAAFGSVMIMKSILSTWTADGFQ